MNEPDIGNVAQHLAVVLAKERHKAMEYTLLTALCTPAFVVVAALFAAFVAAYVFSHASQPLDLHAMAFYTALNAFLAYMLVSVMKSSASADDFQLDKRWIIGALLFIVLLVLTYATSLPQRQPWLFGVTYAIVGFLVLGFVSQVLPPDYTAGDDDPERARVAITLAIPNLITSAYRELLSASWLWFPPQPHEVRIAARLLCRLAADQDNSLSRAIVEERIATILCRLKLVRLAPQTLHLTPKGLDFLQRSHEGAI